MRVKPGDVLELSAPDGVIYAQYLGRHPVYGDAITVCPVKYTNPVSVDPDLFREGYVTFYPAASAVARGFAAVVARLPSPGLPKRMRRPGARYGREVATWIIEGPSGEVVKSALSEEERRLPIAAIWNHEYLVERVSEGWRPEMEGGPSEGSRPALERGQSEDWRPELEGAMDDDRAALKSLLSVSSAGALHVVLHYLYFPEEDAAAAAAAELRSLRFETEERLGADGRNWLVLARHQIVPSEEMIAAVRRTMEEVARRHRGEYDGWEAEVHP